MEYTVINYLFDKGETVSEGICFTSQSKVTGLTGRRHWVLTEESPRLTTIDDNNTLTVFTGYYTRSFIPLSAFLNGVAGISA